MPHAITFDTLSYAKKLISVGVPQEQAEVQAETFSEIIESELATKRDIYILRKDMKEMETSLKRDTKNLETSLKRDMKELEVSVKRDMKELEVSLKRDMKELEQKPIIKLGFLIAASIAIVATLVKLL